MKPCPPSNRGPAGPRGVAPAWSEPMPLAVATAVRTADFDFGAGGSLIVARADPTRIAIGFMLSIVPAVGFGVSPFADVSSFGWPVHGRVSDDWYTLFNVGVTVQNAWYGNSTYGGVLRVVEVYRL